MTESEKKICFVIAPIGDEGSPLRKRSDNILKHLIEPVVHKAGYDAVRSDNIATPGQITEQVIDLVLNAHLVIADLTGQNANVFYELALRHMTGKPFIQLVERGEKLPFDIAQVRTIHIDSSEWGGQEEAMKKLEATVEAIEKSNFVVTSPPLSAINKESVIKLPDPEGYQIVSIAEGVEVIRNDVSTIYEILRVMQHGSRVEIEKQLVGKIQRLRANLSDAFGYISMLKENSDRRLLEFSASHRVNHIDLLDMAYALVRLQKNDLQPENRPEFYFQLFKEDFETEAHLRETLFEINRILADMVKGY